MRTPPPSAAARLGAISAAAVVVIEIAYAAALIAGLAALTSSDQPIQDPWFTIMELLILLLAPVLVTLMAALHICAPPSRKAYSLAALAFTSILAGLTATVHFAVLTLSRQPDFAGLDWLLSFTWPSVAYALDILAWDIFFPLSVLCAACALPGPGLTALARWFLAASGIVAFIGLAGVPSGNMQLRNIGILGYTGIFPFAAAALAVRFRRAGLRTADIDSGTQHDFR